MAARRDGAPRANHRRRVRGDVAAPARAFQAFFGGYCSALSAALYGDDGTATHYVEAIEAAGAEKVLRWARANDEMELPRIRQAVKCIRERRKREARR
jgi:hypothetical protein